MKRSNLFLVLVHLVFTACSLPTEDLSRHVVEPSLHWTANKEASQSKQSNGWLCDFRDQKLRELVEEGLSKNFSFRAAKERLAAANEAFKVSSSVLYPRLSISSDASRTMEHIGEPGERQRIYYNWQSLLVNLSWDLDVWGKLRNEVKRKELSSYIEVARYEGARLSLAAAIAKAWYVLVEAERQLDLTEESLATFEDNLKIVEAGFSRGVNEALDVMLSAANVHGMRSWVAERTSRRDQAARALEVLLGRYPRRELKTTQRLPDIPREIPAGLPSELLARRPDLIVMKLNLLAEEQRLQEAQKALLPSLRLTSSGGLAHGDIEELFKTSSLFWNLIGSLFQPVFFGGELRAEMTIQEARTRETLWSYGESVLYAFHEVEVALANERYIREQMIHLERAVSESDSAQKLAVSQYERGLVDIITVLESQRRAFDTSSQYLSTQNSLLQNRLSLYLALGGDFFNSAPDREETACVASVGEVSQREEPKREREINAIKNDYERELKMHERRKL